jgi:hypothetical protein
MNFFDYLHKIWKPKKSFGPKYSKLQYVSSFSDVPNDTKNFIYVVRSGDFNKWVVFNCPDKCGRRVEVNLMKSKYPKWRLTIEKGQASLSPSVIVDGCNSHFWLYKSRVEWAFDDERNKNTV